MSVPDLFLAVDFGASATKFSFCPGNSESDSKFQVKLMPPDVELISREKLQRYFALNTIELHPRAELDEVWLEAKGQIYALGKLAQQFEPVALISEVKYEKAAYKTLAALGYALSALRQSGQLPKKKVYQVSLAVLLPWSEFPDKERYKSFVCSLLCSAKYRDVRLRVKLAAFAVRQEGFGLFYLYQHISKSYSAKRLTILLFGHRNLSVLLFDSGQSPKGASPRLGFHQVLDGVADSISWLDREQVLGAWSQCWFDHREHFFAGTYWGNSKRNQGQVAKFRRYLGDYDHYVELKLRYPHWQDLPPIRDLARARDPDLRQQEILDIHQALERAVDDYWESFEKWYGTEFSVGDSELLISGGASWFVLPKLAADWGLTVLVGLNAQYTDFWRCEGEADLVGLSVRVYMASVPDSKPSRYEVCEIGAGSESQVADRVALYHRLSELTELDGSPHRSGTWYTCRQRTADVVGLSAYLRERNSHG